MPVLLIEKPQPVLMPSNGILKPFALGLLAGLLLSALFLSVFYQSSRRMLEKQIVSLRQSLETTRNENETLKIQLSEFISKAGQMNTLYKSTLEEATLKASDFKRDLDTEQDKNISLQKANKTLEAEMDSLQAQLTICHRSLDDTRHKSSRQIT